MAYSSQQIGSMIHASQAQMSGNLAYAQQLSYPITAAQYPGQMQPPPPMAPPPMTLGQSADMLAGGMYGEQFSGRLAGAANTALGVGTAGVGMYAAMKGFDPMTAAYRGFRGTSAMGSMMGGGMMGGMMGAASVALPMYAAGAAVDAYAGSFMGGMSDQAGTNSVLRNNFQFMNGSGRMGRGFSQGQMGQIGGTISSMLRQDSHMSSPELNSLIGQGADAGMFTGVRDVQQFTTKFKAMISSLKDIQRELGGSLQEALTFVKQSKSLGIYQGGDRTNFATQLRGASAASGMTQDALMNLSAQGAQIARATGGYGRQGAIGALRGASQLGAAVQTGAINEEMLSDATGGLTGQAAMGSFVADMLQRSGRHSRRGAGRFGIFAMSNRRGTGLDSEMMNRFLAGDISTGEVSRTAHRNVNRMGRARAMNQEGVLRGAVMEQGGLAGMVGMMRLQVGDRVLDQGDERTQNFLRRRYRMNRGQSQIMTSLMRNHSNIAMNQNLDQEAAAREQSYGNDVRDNRSWDGFMRHVGHEMSNSTGVTAAREMGRNFLTKISSMMERTVNELMGVVENELTGADRQSIRRSTMGQGTDADANRLALASMGGARAPGGSDLFRQGAFEVGSSPGARFAARGINLRNASGTRVAETMRAYTQARAGYVTGDDLTAYEGLASNDSRTLREIQRAQLIAGEDTDRTYGILRGRGMGNANAVDAYMAQNQMRGIGDSITQGSLMNRGGSRGGLWDRIMGNDTHEAGPGQQSGLAYLARGGHEGVVNRARSQANGDSEGGFFSRINNLGRTRRRSQAGDMAANSEVDEDVMQSFLEGEDSQTYIQSVMNARDATSAQAGVDNLRRYAGTLEGDEARAAMSMANQLEGDMTRNGGLLSDRMKQTVGGASMSKERRRQLLAERSQAAATLNGFGAAMDEAGLSGDVFRESARVMNEGASPQQFTAAQEAQRTQLLELARMDPTSEEYQALASQLGTSGQGRGLLGSIAGTRQLDRALSGRGRRGNRQRAETALGRLTGGTLGDMDITSSSGRRLNPAQIERMLTRGSSEEREHVLGQISSSLSEGGVTGGREMIQQYIAARQGDSEGGADLSPEERRNLINSTANNDSLRQLSTKAAEARQRRQNPLDTTRNDYLQRMTTAIEAIRDSSGEAVPAGSTDA